MFLNLKIKFVFVLFVSITWNQVACFSRKYFCSRLFRNDAAQSDDDDKSQPPLADTDGGKLKQKTWVFADTFACPSFLVIKPKYVRSLYCWICHSELSLKNSSASLWKRPSTWLRNMGRRLSTKWRACAMKVKCCKAKCKNGWSIFQCGLLQISLSSVLCLMWKEASNR